MAVRINELRQAKIDAQKGLDALLDEQGAARASYTGLLEKSAKGTITEDEKPKLADAEKVVKQFDARLSAQRRLVTIAAEELATEEERLAREDEELRKHPSGRIEVKDPNHTRDPRRGFSSHREFLGAVMRLARRGVEAADERIRPLIVKAQGEDDDPYAGGEPVCMLPLAFTPPAFRATVGSDEQGEYDDRYGGLTLEKSRLGGILQVGFEGDPTAGRTQTIPMGTPSVEIMARVDKNHTSSVSGGFTVARRAETVALTSTRMQLEMITMKASSLFGLAFATEELLADSPASFIAIIDSGMRTQFGAHMLNEKLRGLGGDQYLGVLTALAASSLGPTISIAKEAGQAADTIVAMNVIKARSRCWGYENAIWIANHDTYPQLVTMSIGVGTAGVLVYNEANADRPSSLLGRPIVFSEYASKLGDQGDIILGNWSQFLDGLYQPLQSAESIHVRFLNHERAFKFWLRNAGAPWWRTALTPNKSSDTLSPFVVLDAR